MSMSSSKALLMREKLTWLRAGSRCFLSSVEILGDCLRLKVSALTVEHISTPLKEALQFLEYVVLADLDGSSFEFPISRVSVIVAGNVIESNMI